ncbi:MAG: hypothetical protein K9N21_13855 [Deltaproteobacteria bacterium]|nr:hypothetical protein [Deltaproteobacteria bacterium]
MPLAFDSISHGTIAFGFFNIDSDMLLLDRYFFFATEFCSRIRDIAQSDGPGPYETSWEVYHIPDPADIGDLMGAIHGIHYTGFIGEVYRRFPFPQRPEAFKQKPEGYRTRDDMVAIIEEYARTVEISFSIDRKGGEVSIGPYRFTGPGFQELIRYVWQGGYPRWRDEIRPDYVIAMKEAIRGSSCQVLSGLELAD